MAKKSSAPTKSLRPRARPEQMPDFEEDRTPPRPESGSSSAPTTSLRPRSRPERVRSFNDQTDDGIGRYAKGGMCRGMGAASRGGKYKAT
jgi:hypothetical protein